MKKSTESKFSGVTATMTNALILANKLQSRKGFNHDNSVNDDMAGDDNTGADWVCNDGWRMRRSFQKGADM